jgi:hypothetical protein
MARPWPLEPGIPVRVRAPQLAFPSGGRANIRSLCERPPFSEQAARNAIADGLCWADALRALGYRPIGHNFRTLQRWAKAWGISTAHFDPNAARPRASRRCRIPLAEVLVAGSTYTRGNLKQRLFDAGLKERRCELCGQDEIWHGRPMALILDHINGIGNDHRIENLRIVCPNCAATLDTHCGRNLPRERACAGCGENFAPRHIRQRYCALRCFNQTSRSRAGRPSPHSSWGIPKPVRRKVERPSYEELILDIDDLGYCAVARTYGVSDNAIRKWVARYEREFELLELSGGDR